MNQIFIVVLLINIIFGQKVSSQTSFEQLQNGHHSLIDNLPAEEFYKKFELISKNGSKVILFNFELAKELGLIPLDAPTMMTADLEKKILKTFAYKIDETGSLTGQRKAVAATYYSDGGLNYNSGTGDGRSVWMGEVAVQNEDGNIRLFDINTKGTGRTGLGFDALAGHSDGLTHQADALQEYYSGEVLFKSGTSDASRVLVVIGTDDIRTLSDGHTQVPAGIMVRVSPTNFRFAHLWKFRNNPKQLKKLLSYYFSRDSKYQNQTFSQQLKILIHENIFNSAKEMAIYDNCQFTQASPTRGNRLLNGQLIDFGGFNAFDLYYGDVYADPDLGSVENQKKFSMHWNKELFHILKSLDNLPDIDVDAEFARIYEDNLTRLNLLRIGFSEEQIKMLKKNGFRNGRKLSAAINKLRALQTSESIKFENKTLKMPILDSRMLFAEIPLRSWLNHSDLWTLKNVLDRFGTKFKFHNFDQESAKLALSNFQKELISAVELLSKDNSKKYQIALEIEERASIRNSKKRRTGISPRTIRMREYENFLARQPSEDQVRKYLQKEITEAIDFTIDGSVASFESLQSGFVIHSPQSDSYATRLNQKQLSPPRWLSALISQDANFQSELTIGTSINRTDIQRLGGLLIEMAWESPRFGVLKTAIQNIIEIDDLTKSLWSLKQFLFVEGSQFQFSKGKYFRELTHQMRALQTELPLIFEQDFISQGQQFKIELRGVNDEYSSLVRDSKGKVILTDGPRRLYLQKSSQQWLLTSSLVTTVTDPDFRNFGLYQQVLKVYSDNLKKAQKMFLVSENKETLQFSAFLFDAFEDQAKLKELLGLESIQKAMASLGISAEQVKKSHNQLRNMLLLLSLQGKSRLRSGWTMDYETDFTGKFWSRRISHNDQVQYKIVLKELESDLILESQDPILKSKLINLFSGSYFNFLQSSQKNQSTEKLRASDKSIEILKCKALFGN